MYLAISLLRVSEAIVCSCERLKMSDVGLERRCCSMVCFYMQCHPPVL